MSNTNEKVLMKGNEAIAEAAIRAGCRAYFGYPITPQNELIAYMAQHLMDRGGVFIQAESEVAAINMVYGASCAGARAMTSSSSPGISLKQEGMSYAAGADVPLVLANVVGEGPALAQSPRPRAPTFSPPVEAATGITGASCLHPRACRNAPTSPTSPSSLRTGTVCPLLCWQMALSAR